MQIFSSRRIFNCVGLRRGYVSQVCIGTIKDLHQQGTARLIAEKLLTCQRKSKKCELPTSPMVKISMASFPTTTPSSNAIRSKAQNPTDLVPLKRTCLERPQATGTTQGASIPLSALRCSGASKTRDLRKKLRNNREPTRNSVLRTPSTRSKLIGPWDQVVTPIVPKISWPTTITLPIEFLCSTIRR